MQFRNSLLRLKQTIKSIQSRTPTRNKAVFAGLLIIILVLANIAITNYQKQKKRSEFPPEADLIFGELPQPQLPEYQEPRPQRPTSNLTSINLPQVSPVYKQTKITLSEKEIREIAKNLGFTTEPEIYSGGKNFTFTEADKHLIVITDGTIVFNQELPNFLEDLNQPALENFTKQLLNQIFLDPVWQNPILNIEYLNVIDVHTAEPATQPTANSTTIQVFPTINNTRIVSQYKQPIGKESFTSVSFNKQESFISLKGVFLKVSLEEKGSYPLKPLSTVQAEVRKNIPQTTSIVPEGTRYKNIGPGETHIPNTANYSDLELVYYFDVAQQGFLQPMFLLTGTAQLKDGRTAAIQAILPAIDPQFFQK